MEVNRRWDRLDWILLGAVGALATVLRSIGLGTPKALVFDEFYYVPDACRYVIEIPSLCGPQEFTWMQPPLGKWMIAFGLQILGPTRYGWRIASLFAGVGIILIVYAIARRLFESRVAAVVASGLLTFDFMLFVHSRLAMLDIFLVLFGTIAVLLALLDRDDGAARGLVRPWRWAAGVALGAAMATKWSAGLLAVGIVLLTLLWDARSVREKGTSRWVLIASTVIAYGAIPLVIYMVSYAGRFDNPLLVAPWTDGSWFEQWWQRQKDTLQYHTSIRSSSGLLTHPSSSPPWTWLLLKRPMAYYFDAQGGVYREILSMGHPLLWPLAIPALIWLGIRAVAQRDARDPGTILVVLFACVYLPWFVITGQGPQDPYSYYLLPALPFIYLGFGTIAQRIWAKTVGRAAVIGVALVSVALFAFYRPLLTADPVTVNAWRSRIVFHDCAEFENPALDRLRGYVDPDLPLEGLTREPRPSDRLFPTGTRATGWCWI